MPTLLSVCLALGRAIVMPRATLILENAALRQQLAVALRSKAQPRLRRADRIFWVVLHRLWAGWPRALILVKPATVIGWHRQGFTALWRWKSRPGRPRIPRRHSAFIRRISADHPEWGEDRIAEELSAKFGIGHSGSTIRTYMGPRRSPPRGDQSWRSFVRNHARELWACDFLTQHTAAFTVAYVLVIMEIASRRIVHANVTTIPTLAWVQQQVREATPPRTTPRFLVHDNDAIYGQYRPSVRVVREGRPCRYRCHLDRWLHEVMAITGIPIPYGAPNASPHVERFMRTLREEALDHFLFLSIAHLRRVVNTYVAYYNGARPSQAIHAIPAPYPELRASPPAEGTLIALPVLGGLHHDYRLAA